MAADRPLPGQALPGMPDTDPRAGQFQQAFLSMLATPDDYYRWERDQRIAEQDARAAKAAPPPARNFFEDLKRRWPQSTRACGVSRSGSCKTTSSADPMLTTGTPWLGGRGKTRSPGASWRVGLASGTTLLTCSIPLRTMELTQDT